MPNQTEREIFVQAIELGDPDERCAYLDAACGADRGLRSAVDALLAAHEQPAELLDNPIGEDWSRTHLSASIEPVEHIGMQIGPYKLMEQIGEGGFGLVFVAQQEKPVRRKVALKIVKPGMGSREVVARFEAERQAVAMMNHPNIAQIYDVGVISDGRPYFVMELVRGLPISEFCDKQQLNVEQRLRLAVDVCSAVHHAHQKGVIHRDLKPSNLLVTLYDGKPVAKVIDFGIAKAIGEKLADQSVYTCFFSMMGTPLYMSPEQAEMSGLDVDTRSDIYSLGVVLYELLAGDTPFDRARFNSAGLDEMRRIIREEEPPRPSTRLSACQAAVSTIADRRRSNVSELTVALQGDLDWIIMKSLEKDRARRYDSAAALGDDISRFLNREAIEARPPSSLYRFSKFAARNRTFLTSATLLGLSMLLGTAASLWQMSQAIEERNEKAKALNSANAAKLEAVAAKAEVEQFVQNLVKANEYVVSGQAHFDANRWTEAASDFDSAVSIQPSYYLPRVQRGRLYGILKLWPEASEDYANAMILGAPTSGPEWWGVPALLAYTNNDDAFQRLEAQRQKAIFSNPGQRQWMLLRDLVATSYGQRTTAEDSELLDLALDWLPCPSGPPGPHHPPGGPPPPGGFGGRDQPDNQSDRVPLSICEYVTGLAHLRAGECKAAIDLLSDAGNDARWPSNYLVCAPLAMAYFHEGQITKASEYLERSNAAIIDLLASPASDSRLIPQPSWAEFIEGLQMNREAMTLIRGTSSQIAIPLDQHRSESLQFIGK